MALKSQDLPTLSGSEDIDKELIATIKKVPLKYRAQIIALHHYLKLKTANEDLLKQQVQNIVTKYKKRRLPIINEQNQLIAGERELNEQELNYAKRYLAPQERESLKSDVYKGEPMTDYWFTTLTNCERLKSEIFEVDHPLYKKLRKVENVPDEIDKYNFVIKFMFEENEYFTNEELELRVIMTNQGEQILRIEATPIQWKNGKNITKRLVQKMQQNKKTGEIRIRQTIVQNDTFFNIFRSIRPKGTDQEQENILKEMGEIHSIALMIRDEVLPRNLEYYLGIETGGLNYPVYVEPSQDDDKEKTRETILKQLKENKHKDKTDKKDESTKKEETKIDHVEKEDKRGFCFFFK